MKNDPCDIATRYATRIMASATIDELKGITSEIKGDLAAVAGFEDWLRDIWWSKNKELTTPPVPPEQMYNKAGLRAMEKETPQGE